MDRKTYKKAIEDKMNYGSAKWKKKREHILKLDNYRCQISQRYGKLVPAVVVHHIYPAEEYPAYAWEDWNLISVSKEVHNQLENRQTGELTEDGKKLQRETRPGENWREKKWKT